MSVVGSDYKRERFETALYDNYLYKPVLLNLEFKIVSKDIGPNGKPNESLVVNAHICAVNNPIKLRD